MLAPPGTINGIGERCGNADLSAVLPNLVLKMGYSALHPGAISEMTRLSRMMADLLAQPEVLNQPFVGRGAFAHKGGMHVHAVQVRACVCAGRRGVALCEALCECVAFEMPSSKYRSSLDGGDVDLNANLTC